MEELVEVLEENGEAKGFSIDKSIAHQQGICHGISAVAIIDNGRVLLQKRSKNKKIEPNKWDLSSAGHIDYNEPKEEAMVREIKEELGLDVNEDELELIDNNLIKFQLKDTYLNHFTYLFIIRKNINIRDVKISKEEVSEIRFFNKQEYLDLLKSNEIVVGLKYCNKIIDYLR